MKAVLLSVAVLAAVLAAGPADAQGCHPTCATPVWSLVCELDCEHIENLLGSATMGLIFGPCRPYC